ncbi:hypothetical protein Y032_0037g3523 [Ancylostoma ceylanicum]|uniref:Oxidoreductase, short chain dehydrogenase/reductase family protein n=1 Tax=Ancylostoma ceylanicum TaxID=53326 RepID=A0A016UKJ6_9BILA|nr:hypothetical protein Y032_0037g3523 [Ancylostoma ceylanicum]
MVLSGKRVLTVVSGASRGIGKEIAVQVSKRVAPESVFLLTARNEATLLQIKQDILSSSEKAQVWIVVCDMGSFNDDAINTFKEVLGEIKEMGPFDSAFVFHNCGTAGDVSKRSTELSNAEQWQNYLNVNLIAMVQFNNLILESITKEVAPHRFVVNITSLVAIQGFPSLTQVRSYGPTVHRTLLTLGGRSYTFHFDRIFEQFRIRERENARNSAVFGEAVGVYSGEPFTTLTSTPRNRAARTGINVVCCHYANSHYRR